MTGHAHEYQAWDSGLESITFHYMMEYAQEVDRYDAVIERYGEEAAFGLLEEHAPRKARLVQEGLVRSWLGVRGAVP